MKCSNCPTGILSRNKKPDALGRIIEKCDACAYRRTISGDEDVVVPLSGSLTGHRPHQPRRTISSLAVLVSDSDNAVIVDRPSAGARTLPPLVPGKRCPYCDGKVPHPRPCITCRVKPALPRKRRCADCFKAPGYLPPRYCVKCGTKYTPKQGDPKSSATKCPAHQTKATA